MKKYPITLLLLLSVFLSACKNPADDIIINIDTSSLFKSPLLVHFNNAGAAALSDFDVNISGKDSALVQMGTGGTNFKAVDGMMSLALKSTAKPSEDKPIVFVVNAQIPGYADVRKTIVITGDSSFIYQIPLSKYVKPVEGTSIAETETLLKHGTATETFKLSTVSNSKLAQTATVTIEKGTQVLDADKKIIDANVLKSTLTLYGLSSTSLAAAFPNGLSDINGPDQTGSLVPGGVSYTTAGLLKVAMAAAETTVRHFSQPISISQELPSGIINPDTKLPITAGDIIPLFDGASGSYKPTAYTATVAIANGKLVANYSIPYTSTWNLAWRKSATLTFINRNLDIQFQPSKSTWNGAHTVQIQSNKGTYLTNLPRYTPEKEFYKQGRLVNGTTVYTSVTGKYGYGLVTVPNVSAAKIVVIDARGKSLGQSAVFDPRTASSVDIKITVPDPIVPSEPGGPEAPPEYINITADFTGKCVSKNIIAPINSWVTINDLTDKKYSYVYIKSGAIDQPGGVIKLVVGHEYKISATYQGKAYSTGTFPIKKANMDIPSAAENFSVVTAYDASSNIIKITGVLNMDCK